MKRIEALLSDPKKLIELLIVDMGTYFAVQGSGNVFDTREKAAADAARWLTGEVTVSEKETIENEKQAIKEWSKECHVGDTFVLDDGAKIKCAAGSRCECCFFVTDSCWYVTCCRSERDDGDSVRFEEVKE